MQSFHRLRKLRIDFDPAKSNAALLQRFKCLSVQELELYDISWPSPGTLKLVAKAFPNLRSLKLAQDLMWCNQLLIFFIRSCTAFGGVYAM